MAVVTFRFPWGRIIAGILSAAAFIASVLFAWECWQLCKKCVDAQVTALAVFPDAFGATGTFQADFSPKYDFTCKEVLHVESGLPCRSYEDIGAILAGLRAVFVIEDVRGVVVLDENLTEESFRLTWTMPGADTFPPTFPFRPVRPGDYQIRLTVHEPAASLVNIPHRVVARYELCGVEHLAAIYLGSIAFVALLVSVSLVISVVVVTKRRQSRNMQALEDNNT